MMRSNEIVGSIQQLRYTCWCEEWNTAHTERGAPTLGAFASAPEELLLHFPPHRATTPRAGQVCHMLCHPDHSGKTEDRAVRDGHTVRPMPVELAAAASGITLCLRVCADMRVAACASAAVAASIYPTLWLCASVPVSVRLCLTDWFCPCLPLYLQVSVCASHCVDSCTSTA